MCLLVLPPVLPVFICCFVLELFVVWRWCWLFDGDVWRFTLGDFWYPDLRVKHVSSLNPARFQADYNRVNDFFERPLILLNKMPRIWTDYLSSLLKQCLATKIRRTFDRALRALPLTHPSRIWALFPPFANSALGETALRILETVYPGSR